MEEGEDQLAGEEVPGGFVVQLLFGLFCSVVLSGGAGALRSVAEVAGGFVGGGLLEFWWLGWLDSA